MQRVRHTPARVPHWPHPFQATPHPLHTALHPLQNAPPPFHTCLCCAFPGHCAGECQNESHRTHNKEVCDSSPLQKMGPSITKVVVCLFTLFGDSQVPFHLIHSTTWTGRSTDHMFCGWNQGHFYLGVTHLLSVPTCNIEFADHNGTGATELRWNSGCRNDQMGTSILLVK